MPCPEYRRSKGESNPQAGSSILFGTYPKIYPKLIRLAREYRCLGGIPSAVKSFIVKVIWSLARKRSIVWLQPFRDEWLPKWLLESSGGGADYGGHKSPVRLVAILVAICTWKPCPRMHFHAHGNPRDYWISSLTHFISEG